MAKYKARSKHVIKCYVCGSKEFTETYIENAASRMCISHFGMEDSGAHKRDAWLYVCIDCGYLLAFADKASLHESFI